jgi:hypothetical protein
VGRNPPCTAGPCEGLRHLDECEWAGGVATLSAPPHVNPLTRLNPNSHIAAHQQAPSWLRPLGPAVGESHPAAVSPKAHPRSRLGSDARAAQSRPQGWLSVSPRMGPYGSSLVRQILTRRRTPRFLLSPPSTGSHTPTSSPCTAGASEGGGAWRGGTVGDGGRTARGRWGPRGGAHHLTAA